MQLARVSALPTALSNIMLGYLLATHQHAGKFVLAELAAVMLVSAFLYSAGMILNDVFDVDQDRLQRPERPLPSERIGVATARNAGIFLLILGVVLIGFVNGKQLSSSFLGFLRPILLASLLAIAILAYDNWLKRTWLSPWLMGACRSCNLLLGASIVSDTFEFNNASFGFEPVVLAISLSLGLYVAGITFVGKKEAVENPSRLPLWLGSGLIVLGVVGFSFSNLWFSEIKPSNQKLADTFPLLMLLMAFPVVRRSITAALQGTRKAMQSAVVTGLRSIIVFDAALCFLAAPDRPGYALSVLSLLVPSMLLSRWLNPT
jgi:4-hydroxybenzoate polyprenyltransferase